MRTTLLTAVLAIAAVAACGNKTPSKPVGTGSDGATGSATPVEPDTGSGSGSDTTMTPPDSGSGSGSGSAADAGSGSGSGSGSDTATTGTGDEDTFLAMTKEEKLKIMKTQVLPTMGKAFKAFDKKDFAKFGCKTCHSKASVADGSYKMPNPDLPKLDFKALEAGKQEPKTAEFMKTTVLPGMVKILGVTGYDEDHPKGFGCLNCHTMKQ